MFHPPTIKQFRLKSPQTSKIKVGTVRPTIAKQIYKTIYNKQVDCVAVHFLLFCLAGDRKYPKIRVKYFTEMKLTTKIVVKSPLV